MIEDIMTKVVFSPACLSRRRKEGDTSAGSLFENNNCNYFARLLSLSLFVH